MQNFCPFSPLRRVILLSLSYLSILFSLEAWVCLLFGGCRHIGNVAGWLQRKTDSLGKTETLAGVRLLVPVLLLVLLLPSPSSAITNPDFIDGYAGWTPHGIGEIGGGAYDYWHGIGEVNYFSSGSYDDSSYVQLRAYDSEGTGGDDGDSSWTLYLSQPVDITGYDTLNFYGRMDYSQGVHQSRVYVGSKYASIGSSSWHLYSMNISDLSGIQTLKVYAYAYDSYGGSYSDVKFSVDHFYLSNSGSPDIPTESVSFDTDWNFWIWFYGVIGNLLSSSLFAIAIAFLICVAALVLTVKYLTKNSNVSLKAPNNFVHVDPKYPTSTGSFDEKKKKTWSRKKVTGNQDYFDRSDKLDNFLEKRGKKW